MHRGLLRILHIGKTSSSHVRQLVEEFIKRSKRFDKVELQALKTKVSSSMSPEVIKAREGEVLSKSISKEERVILLDERGRGLDSRSFAEWLEREKEIYSSPLVFIIGGAYGFSEEMRSRADHMISLSPMTFNHELALFVLTEQIYRALTIINGHPYHND
jgi:23S rRNA (pseudouridine1915-N3)-methyltransferase